MDGLLVKPISHEIDQGRPAKTPAAKEGEPMIDHKSDVSLLYRDQNLSTGDFVITFNLSVN